MQILLCFTKSEIFEVERSPLLPCKNLIPLLAKPQICVSVPNLDRSVDSVHALTRGAALHIAFRLDHQK